MSSEAFAGDRIVLATHLMVTYFRQYQNLME